MNPTDGNGWDKWQKYVLLELEHVREYQKVLDKKITNNHLELTTLKAKLAVWGTIVFMGVTAVQAAVFKVFL